MNGAAVVDAEPLSRRVVIMAGGTGGHVFPGLAVAEELRRRGVEVTWLGTVRGIEARLVPAAGFSLRTLQARGLRGGGAVRWLSAPFMLLRGVWQAFRALRQLRPGLVLGMGGYVAGPGGLAAWLLRCPLVLHEQNAVIGLTNRLLLPLSRVALFGFPQVTGVSGIGDYRAQGQGDEQADHYRRLFVGNPVSQPMSELAGGTGRFNRRDSDDPVRLLVLGGSQGARAINQLVVALAATPFASRLQIIHQCGRGLFDETVEAYQSAGLEPHCAAGDEIDFQSPAPLSLCGFIANMPAVYQWADLVVARAGAQTVSELCAAALPSILIPLPSAAGDHQTANAAYLADSQAARLLPQRELTVDKLIAALKQVCTEKVLALMANSAAALARTDAAQQAADICLEQYRA